MQRHELIYLNPKTNFAIQSSHQTSIIRQQIEAWLSKGLPCIYTRQLLTSKQVSLGLPLHVNDKKFRVNLMVPKTAIIKNKPLPNLIDMQEFFLNFYGIKEIETFLESINTTYPFPHFKFIAVYGSFLFHYLSGQQVVSENSDLDLLLEYPGCSKAALHALILLLNEQFKRPIDGEIRFTKLGDIAFRELFNDKAESLLCKSHNNLVLIPRTLLYECYPALRGH